jgi:hypothetical protein
MRYRHILFAVVGTGLTALLPAVATADAGATLTVAGQVQAAADARPVLQPTFTFPEATPFCTVGVDFTWDGGSWVSEFPTKDGALCVATGVNLAAPNGKNGAGQHQVCASAGVRFKDCKTVTVVLNGQAAPGTAASAAPGSTVPGLTPPDANAAPAPAASNDPIANAPAPARAIAAATHLLPVQVSIGIVVLAIGVIALVALLTRRMLLRGRARAKAALPSPDQRR